MKFEIISSRTISITDEAGTSDIRPVAKQQVIVNSMTNVFFLVEWSEIAPMAGRTMAAITIEIE